MAGPKPPCTYLIDVQLGLHAGPEQLEQWQSQKLLPVHGICGLLAGPPCLASVGEEVPSLTET